VKAIYISAIVFSPFFFLFPEVSVFLFILAFSLAIIASACSAILCGRFLIQCRPRPGEWSRETFPPPKARRALCRQKGCHPPVMQKNDTSSFLKNASWPGRSGTMRDDRQGQKETFQFGDIFTASAFFCVGTRIVGIIIMDMNIFHAHFTSVSRDGGILHQVQNLGVCSPVFSNRSRPITRIPVVEGFGPDDKSWPAFLQPPVV